MKAAKQFHPHGWKPTTWGRKSPAVESRCKLYRTKAWFQLRQQVIERDKWTCQLCGRFAVGKGNQIVDHDPPCQSEADVICSIDRLRLVCAKCHAKRTLRDRNATEGADVSRLE